MRPRKSILLYAPRPFDLGSYRLVLQARMHVHVSVARTPEHLRAELERCPHAVVCFGVICGAAETILRTHRSPDTRMVASCLPAYVNGIVAEYNVRFDASMAEVIDVLKNALARKRGPKRQERKAA